MITLSSLHGDFSKLLPKLLCKWVLFNCYWNLYFFMHINTKTCTSKEGGVMHLNIISLKEEWNTSSLLHKFFFGTWVNFNHIFFLSKYSCSSFKHLVKESDNNMSVISLKLIGGITIVMFWYDAHILSSTLILLVSHTTFNLEAYMHFTLHSYRK